MKRVCVAELERLTGFTSKTVKKRLGDLEPIGWDAPNLILYDSVKALTLLFGSKEKSDIQNLSQERALLAKSQRERNDLIIAQIRKDLVPTDKVLSCVENMFSAVKAKLLLMPIKLSLLLADRQKEEIHTVIEESVRETLLELSLTEIEKVVEQAEVKELE